MCRILKKDYTPVDMAIQSFILRALSMALPVASISSRRLSRALLTTRLTSSSLSSSSESRRKADFAFVFASLGASSPSSELSSSSDFDSEEEESEPSARRRKRDMAGLAGTALAGAASSPELRRDSSESDDSESESAACLKNLDIVVRIIVESVTTEFLGFGDLRDLLVVALSAQLGDKNTQLRCLVCLLISRGYCGHP